MLAKRLSHGKYQERAPKLCVPPPIYEGLTRTVLVTLKVLPLTYAALNTLESCKNVESRPEIELSPP